MNNSWTKQVWAEALPVYNDIIDHPFIKELASGSLPVECFDRYLAQDELYVGNYGRQMFELADLITDPEQHAMFEAFAREGIEGEKAMHQLLIERFGIDTKVLPSTVTADYNAHTQEAIATELGMSIHQYQRYEYGESSISNCRMRIGLQICAVLELDPYEVVFNTAQ